MIFSQEIENIPDIRTRIEKKLELLREEWKKKPTERYVTENQARMLEIAIFKLDQQSGDQADRTPTPEATESLVKKDR